MPPCFLKKNKSSILTRVIQGICGTSFTLLFALFIFFLSPSSANAAVNIPLTINLSETVNVTGTPRIAVDVGGTTRYATYSSGTGSNTLTFTLSPQAGDVDLDGVTVSSPIDLNGGTIKDVKGNNAALTFTPPSTTNVKVNYPSLGMDFVYDADGRYTLNGTVYNDLTSFLSAAGGTFTRASTATYFDSTGTLQTAASGVPRFDYDPVTHAAKGILIEESRTNLATYSEQMDNWSGPPVGISIAANTHPSPMGVMAVDTLLEDTSNGQHYKAKGTVAYASSTVYTVSIFVKPAGRSVFQLASFFGYSPGATFDLSTMTATPTGTTSSQGIQNIGNGWYRCYATRTSTGGNDSVLVRLLDSSGNISYTGDGTSGLYVWGAQLEVGAFPTSYIPTTTSTVTRAADALSIPLSAWFNATNSSIFSTTTSSGMSVNSWPGISDFNQSGTERFGTYYNSLGSGLVSQQRSGGINPAAGKNGSYSGIPVKMAASFGGEGSHLSVNGSSPLASASGGFPSSLTTMRIGRFDDYLNGNLSSIKYYPTRVTDTQLQLLTQ